MPTTPSSRPPLRTLAAVAVLGLAATVLGACGGGRDGDTPPASATPAPRPVSDVDRLVDLDHGRLLPQALRHHVCRPEEVVVPGVGTSADLRHDAREHRRGAGGDQVIGIPDLGGARPPDTWRSR